MSQSELSPSDWDVFCSRHDGFPRWVDFRQLEGGQHIVDTLEENPGWPMPIRRLVLGRLLEKGEPHEWVNAAINDPENAYPFLISAILEQGSSANWLHLFTSCTLAKPDSGSFVERFATDGTEADLLVFVFSCRKRGIRLADEQHTKLRTRARQVGGERGVARYDLTRDGVHWPYQAQGLRGYIAALGRAHFFDQCLRETDLQKRLGYLGFDPAIGLAGILAALGRRLGLRNELECAFALGVSRRTLRAWVQGEKDPDNTFLLRMGQRLGLHATPALPHILGTIQARYGWHSWYPLAQALAVRPHTIERWARGRARPRARLIPALLFLAESVMVSPLSVSEWTQYDRDPSGRAAREVDSDLWTESPDS